MITNQRKILLLPGDGIGPEVVGETKKVIDWFNKHELEVTYMNNETSLLAIQGPKVIDKLTNYFLIPEKFHFV